MKLQATSRPICRKFNCTAIKDKHRVILITNILFKAVWRHRSWDMSLDIDKPFILVKQGIYGLQFRSYICFFNSLLFHMFVMPSLSSSILLLGLILSLSFERRGEAEIVVVVWAGEICIVLGCRADDNSVLGKQNCIEWRHKQGSQEVCKNNTNHGCITIYWAYLPL